LSESAIGAAAPSQAGGASMSLKAAIAELLGCDRELIAGLFARSRQQLRGAA